MNKIPLILLFLCILSCTSAKIMPPPSPPKTSCPGDLFMEATGTGKSISLASSKAKAQIVSNIISQVESQTSIGESSNENEGILDESSSYSSESHIKSNFTLLGFREMESRQIGDSLYEYKGYVCNSDAAKPYLDSLRVYKDSLEFFIGQKPDSDICGKAREIRKNMMGFETILAVLRRVDKTLRKKYEDIYEEIKEGCGLEASKKLYWNPEKETAYSEIAFSKLSTGIKMETSPCKGKGIKLIYKGEPECKSNGGPYGCMYQPSLLIATCNGAKIRLLESPAVVKGFDQKEDIAKKKLQDKLKAEDFWNEWEQEIKHRSSE